MPTSHSPQVREAGEADDDKEDPDARAPPAVLAADDDDPMPDVPRGMARPLQ